MLLTHDLVLYFRRIFHSHVAFNHPLPLFDLSITHRPATSHHRLEVAGHLPSTAKLCYAISW